MVNQLFECNLISIGLAVVLYTDDVGTIAQTAHVKSVGVFAVDSHLAICTIYGDIGLVAEGYHLVGDVELQFTGIHYTVDG